MSSAMKTARALLVGAAIGLAATSAPCAPSDADDRAERAVRALQDGHLDDDAQALATLRDLAESGHPQAQYDLGLVYLNGMGVSQDLPAAVGWWKKAAEQGHVNAQYKLAHSYREGRGIEPDAGKAFYWYTRAAEQGDAEAQYNVGYSYRIGYGTTKSLADAARWYERAAEGGDIQARAALAQLYATEGFERYSPAVAYKWLLLVLPRLALYEEGPRAEAEGLKRRLESMLAVDERERARKAADEWRRQHPKENVPKPIVEVSIQPTGR
jgi:TPR repeat protein